MLLNWHHPLSLFLWVYDIVLMTSLCFCVQLPQQQNSYDCGLFLLHYVELFLEGIPVNFNPFKITKFSNFVSVLLSSHCNCMIFLIDLLTLWSSSVVIAHMKAQCFLAVVQKFKIVTLYFLKLNFSILYKLVPVSCFCSPIDLNFPQEGE